LNKRQFDDSKAVIKSQNMFGLHGNVWAQKTSKINIFLWRFPKKTKHERKKLLIPKMVTSTSSIYGKIFRLLSFEVMELCKIQFSWGARPCTPSRIPLQRFQLFLNLCLCLQTKGL
jgi:hypothetical protein